MKDSNFSKKKPSILRRTYRRYRRTYNSIGKFLSRVSDGYVLRSSTSINSINEYAPANLDEISIDQLEKRPESVKAILDQALKDKTLQKINPDLKSQEFRDEVNKRVFIKNIKQKCAFVVGSVPMFSTLKKISILTALNPQAVVSINLPFYFGISMPAFVTLHMVEHTLPIGIPRSCVKVSKVLIGLPFCITSELVDKGSNQILKPFKIPTSNLDMQGTLGVPSDLKLSDVLDDMVRMQRELEIGLDK